MAKAKGLKQKQRYYNVSKVVVDDRLGFKATCKGTNGKPVLLPGLFSKEHEAAKAADLACLASGRKGPLNFNKNIFLQKDVIKERERLKQLGVVAAEVTRSSTHPRHRAPVQPHAKQEALTTDARDVQQQGQLVVAIAEQLQHKKKKGRSKVQEQVEQQQPAPAAAVQDPAHGAKGSRKRKATSAGEADNAACVALPSSAQQQQHSPGAAVVVRPKRRKTQLQAPARPASEAAEPESLPSATQPTSNQHSAAAAAVPVPASTALVPAVPRQVVVPTGSTVQLGVDSSNQMMMQQLRSALAAHEASKRQLRVALEALEASEGQLAAVARAAGLL